MNTAYFRSIALDLHARCEWQRAAQAYQQAIEHYPAGAGQLRERDLSNLAERRDACLSMQEAA